MPRMLSGHPQGLEMPPPPDLDSNAWAWAGAGSNTALVGPWGLSYATNLTPDQNTGIGIWTEKIFIDAISRGRHQGHSRQILPPMPWQNYAFMSDEDLRAILSFPNRALQRAAISEYGAGTNRNGCTENLGSAILNRKGQKRGDRYFTSVQD